jgi:hypothetical protein
MHDFDVIHTRSGASHSQAMASPPAEIKQQTVVAARKLLRVVRKHAKAAWMQWDAVNGVVTVCAVSAGEDQKTPAQFSSHRDDVRFEWRKPTVQSGIHASPTHPPAPPCSPVVLAAFARLETSAELNLKELESLHRSVANRVGAAAPAAH